MKYSTSFGNSRPWLKISLKGRLKSCDLIMEVSTPQTSKEFKDLYREAWIKRELTTSYNPQ
jgi:hypothetical protein